MNKQAEADVARIRQTTQYSCCAASIASALKAHGKNVTEDDVNKILGAAPMAGASWEAMLATIQYFGLRGSLVIPATPQMLKNWTDQGIPVIIAWNPEGRPWSHASTVFDVTEGPEGLLIHVMDPNIPNPSKTVRVLGEDEFCQKWSEKVGDTLLVRRPACAIEREITEDGMQVRLANKQAAVVRTVTIQAPKQRDLATPALRERGGKGHHKNKQDFDRGHARSPKHKRPYEVEAAYSAGGGTATWQPMSGGWKYVDSEILAMLIWEDTWSHVRDRDIPPLEDLADPEMLADGIPESMQSYYDTAKDWDQWQQQGWWPKPVKDKGLLLTIMHRPTRKVFEARFKKTEVRKAQEMGIQAIEVIRGKKHPRWMTPEKMAAMDSRYKGNPGGQPVYDQVIDHGVDQALSGGHDIMKRLQDQYRIEQGHSPRDPNPRLARWNDNTSAQVERLTRRFVFAQIEGDKQ